MAKPVWQQRLQARLDNSPLYWEKPSLEEKLQNPFEPSRVVCGNCGGSGKRVSLRELVNYSFNTCYKCGYIVR